MRKIILLTFPLTLCASNLWAQKPACDFLGPLHFKNGKATVIVKALYSGFTETNDPYLLERLSKKKILNGNKYFNINFKGEGSKGGTDLDFIPEGCSNFHYATVAKTIALTKLKWLQTLYLKCTVYRGIIDEKKQPYFTVDEINYTQKDIPVVDAIYPLMYLENLPNDDDHSRYFTNAEPNNCLLYTTLNKATIQTSDHKYHYFYFIKHTKKRDGYIDLYKSGNDTLELNISRIFNKGEDIITIARGVLTATLGEKRTVLKVSGMGDDIHQNNHK